MKTGEIQWYRFGNPKRDVGRRHTFSAREPEETFREGDWSYADYSLSRQDFCGES